MSFENLSADDATIFDADAYATERFWSHRSGQGFSVDGFRGSDDTMDSWVDKCVWVEGGVEDGMITHIEGFIMQDMTIRNCG